MFLILPLFYRNDYQTNNMHQYYFIVLSVFYFSLLAVDSTPLPADSGNARSEEFGTIKAPSPSIFSAKFQECKGLCWVFMVFMTVLLILLTGILAGLTLAIMSVDATRLRVWMNTGGPKQRSVLKLHVSTLETYGFLS